MKKKEKIFLIIGIILLLLILTHFFIFNLRMIVSPTYCESRDDCRIYSTGCCDWESTNKFHRLFKIEEISTCHQECPPTITRCENNQCVLESLPIEE